MTNTIQDLQQEFRGALMAFWDEQLQIEPEGDGLAVALPLMDSAGWQVVVHLTPLTPGQWRLSDHGATLGMLDDTGKRPDGKKLKEVIDAQCRFYGFERDGLVLQRTLRHPFEPSEIQIFAEGLVALSHLCPKTRRAVTTRAAERIEDRIQRYFYQRAWTPKRNYPLAGQIEPAIKVDFYWEGARPLALQPVERTRNLRSYMEQWGWRWTDLHRAHDNLVKAMVYDPDNQAWDDASRRIGEKVCDIFVPIHDSEAVLDEFMAA